MNKIIGKRIRKLREDKNLSQESIADRLKISRSAYQRLENGETYSWAVHLEELCLVLEVSPDELLKSDDSLVLISRDNSSAIVKSKKNTINIYESSEKVIEQLQTRILEYQDTIKELKGKIKELEKTLD